MSVSEVGIIEWTPLTPDANADIDDEFDEYAQEEYVEEGQEQSYEEQ